MQLQQKPLSDITHQAITILSRELGVADAIRFINQFNTGHGDYTEERRSLFEGMSLDDILAGIRVDRPDEEVRG